MTSIILNRIHKNADSVIRQLFNYDRYFDGNSIYLFHRSLDSDINESHLIDKLPFSLKNRVFFCSQSYPTQWMCTLGGYIALYKEMVSKGLNADNVFIHSDGDLLLGGNAKFTFDKYRAGYGSFHFSEKSNWFWTEKVKSDQYLKMLASELEIKEDEFYFGRQDGAFYPFNEYMDIMKIVTKLYENDVFLSSISTFYPIEEVVFPTFFNKIILDKSEKCENLIFTKENDFLGGRGTTSNLNKYITIEDIFSIKNKKNDEFLWGAKWFNPSIADSAALLACQI
jgi:hypothetical protein